MSSTSPNVKGDLSRLRSDAHGTPPRLSDFPSLVGALVVCP